MCGCVEVCQETRQYYTTMGAIRSTKGLKLVLLVTGFLALFRLSGAPPICPRDHYWFRITGTCEPCSRICDPPGRHENDCPRLCPDYIPTTPQQAVHYSTSTPEPGPAPRPLQDRAPETTGSETYSMPWPYIAPIMIVVLGANMAIGCLLYKKRKSLKECPLVRRLFGKVVYHTTVKAMCQPTDSRQGGEPEHRQMLGNQHEEDGAPGEESIL